MRWRWGNKGDGNYRVWAHWTNESAEAAGRPCFPWDARFWVHFGSDNCLGIEWVLRRFQFGVGLEVDAYGGEHDLAGHVQIPMLSFYWYIDKVWPRKYRKKISEWWKQRLGYDTREIDWSIHDWGIYWNLWTKWGESGSFPRWREGCFDIPDFFLGRSCVVYRELAKEDVLVPMPERAYRGTVTLYERTYTRRRLPWAQRIKTAEIKMHPGEQVPIPGKGENSWDLGQDATYSMSCPETTIEGAVAAMVKSALGRRRRYGGPDWVPEEVVKNSS